jgi:hypothetical protein
MADHDFRCQSMAQRIASRPAFSGGGFWTGAFEGVEAIGFDLLPMTSSSVTSQQENAVDCMPYT